MTRHGTNSRYVNQACRCDSCKAAHHRALKLNNTARHRARVWLARENPVRYRELLEMAYHDLADTEIAPVGHPRNP